MSDSIFSGSEGTAKLIYFLYLVGLVTGGLTLIVAVVIAYMTRDDAADWLQSHYSLIIRTFWIGMLFVLSAWLLMFIGALLTVVLVGYIIIPLAALLGLLAAVWLIIRCAKGIKLVDERRAIDNPLTWMFPRAGEQAVNN